MSRAQDVRNWGYGRMVREALGRTDEPLSVYRLELQTGLKPEQIRSALARGMTEGGIVSQRSKRGYAIYSLYRAPIEKAKSDSSSEFRIAGRITHGRGSRWWASLV